MTPYCRVLLCATLRATVQALKTEAQRFKHRLSTLVKQEYISFERIRIRLCTRPQESMAP